MGAEISRCDKRDDATLLFSVAVLMYARIVFSKIKGLLSRKWLAARSILCGSCICFFSVDCSGLRALLHRTVLKKRKEK